MQTYSGKREKGQCVLFSNVTCPKGTLVAVTPGPNISCTPRGGDGTSLGLQFDLARNQQDGFTRLFRGTADTGTSLNFDRGYIYQAHNVNTGNNPTMLEFCLQNDVLPLFRTIVGDQCFR